MKLVDLDDSQTSANDSSRDLTLSDLITGAAVRFPRRPAVRHDSSTVTYGDLLRLREKIGAAIVNLCRSPGQQLVGVFMERSSEMVASLLAVHQTGNAFVPMDPSLPTGRLSSMLSDCRPALILAQRSLASSAALQGTPSVCVEDLVEDCADEEIESSGSPHRAVSPMACVVYTSGSTGDAKGVQITHAGLINQILWRKQQFQIDEGDRVLQTFSLAFDPSLWEIFGTLEAGACIVLNEETFDAARVVKSVLNEGVTVMQTVPSMLRQLLDQDEFRVCSRLRHVICGGEVLEPDTVRQFYDAIGSAQLHNLYGPTEATIDATCWTCSPQDLGPRVPIGRPIANTQVVLLDEQGLAVPLGEPGEIHVAGPGVATGYYGKPALTAERFVKYRGEQSTSGTYYKTGDRAVARDDGVIEFLGRMDRQIKIHGYRVEPGEVESVLARHPLVEEAAVVAKLSPGGASVLVAYVAPDRVDAHTMREEVRQYATSLLPSYMVPSIVVPMAVLPRNVANKVDLGALPEPSSVIVASRHSPSLTSPTEPWAEEQQAEEIWCQVLGLESFDLDANFFELGGDSVALSVCISKLERAFGHRVSPGEFFTRSFREIATILREQTS